MNQHILIVDDEAPIREMLQLALGRNNFRITDVSSAAAARQVVRTDPPQLIISDLQLEDSDGLQMLAEIKKELPDVPMILLTGVLFDAQVVDETVGKLSAVYLHKTTPLSGIIKEVRQLLKA